MKIKLFLSLLLAIILFAATSFPKAFADTSPTANRQIVFVHGIKTNFSEAQNCNNSGFQSIWCNSSYKDSVHLFPYYQDLGYKLSNGNGCGTQPAPDTNIGPLYAPPSNNVNHSIDPNTCDSQSAIAYNSTGLDNFLSTLTFPVAIINYSMGAPITRGWLTLAENRQNDNTLNIVDTLISIQGVQQGSYLPLGALPILNAASWSSPLLSAVIQGAGQLTGWNKDRPAEADLTPGSQWYQSTLSQNVPLSMHYFNFYSDIKVSARPQFFFRVLPSIGSVSFGDTVILPGKSDPTAKPLTGGARFLPYGWGNGRYEFAVNSNHDLLLGDGLFNPLQRGSVLGVSADVLNDPISHVNLNKHLDEDNNALKVDSCRGQEKITIQNEILRILENPADACGGES